MNVKFMSNKISLQNKKFEDFVAGIVNKDGLRKEASVKTAEKECDEAPSSGQPEAEAKLVNRPKKEEGKGKGKGGKADNTEAPSSGQPEAEAKLVNDPKKKSDDKKSDDKKSKSTKETKVAEVEVEVVEEQVEEIKKANADVFVKIAKLNSKNRAELRKYWRTLFPEAYVEAMLAEK